ncbi:MAG: ABC transporter substrate-binding protein, partial [Acutalibacteraceae bacterium]
TSGNASSGASTASSLIDTSKIKTVDGLNFGGKTVKIAITSEKTPTASDKRMFADFEKAYNCKIKYDVIAFSDFLKTVSNKIASNQPYDILYMHGSMFPNAAISRLSIPLDAAVYEADKMDKNNPAAGGIDMEKSSYFSWKNNLYAVAGYTDINVVWMYYNKQKFKDSGLEDPLTLYNSGKWTWEKLLEMGKKVTNEAKGSYFGDYSFCCTAVPYSYGGKWIKINSYSDVKENTSDPHLFNGLKMLQQMTGGPDKICDLTKGVSQDPTAFVSGTTYAFIGEDLRYSASISPAVIDDKKMNGKLDNIGIVPLPLGDGNKAYPAGWIQGISACRGTQDITMAVAFAKFRSSWKDSGNDPYKLPQSALDLRLKLLGNLNYCDYGYYSGGTGATASVASIAQQITVNVAKGQDIKTILDKYSKSIQNCIDVTLKK